MTQLNELSVSRLVSRTTYYRDKALELNRQNISFQEEIESLQRKMVVLKRENQRLEQQWQEAAEKTFSAEERNQLHGQIKELQAANELTLAEKEQLLKQFETAEHQLSELKQKLKEEQVQNEHLRAQLENSGELGVSSDVEAKLKQLESKIAGYEGLLVTIQQEMNEKEREIDRLKSKSKSLEKRAQYSGMQAMNLVKQEPKLAEHHNDQEKEQLLAFFNYSVLWQAKEKLLIRGDLHVKNIGNQRLNNPSICFRFVPPESAALKGKIMSLEQAASNQQTGQKSFEWMFLESDWGRDAKDRGEIWLVPTSEKEIAPGETVSVQQFQIPITAEYPETFVVEGFVYIQEPQLTVKTGNQIIVSL